MIGHILTFLFKNSFDFNYNKLRNLSFVLLSISYIDGLAQDCSNSNVLTMELLQSCTKPSIYRIKFERNISRLLA